MIEIDSGVISTTDFSSPAFDRERGIKAPMDELIGLKDNEGMDVYKNKLIEKSFNTVKEMFTKK